MSEHTEVVIVGSRCAGSAAAIALARRGRSVIALDTATFPSDTLSTHLFFPNHWAELELLGARERVLAEVDPPLHSHASLGAPGVEMVGRYRPYDGLDYGSCVRRPGLDNALVETARAAGVEVRERTKVTGLLRDNAGRVIGVRAKQRGGEEYTITAKLVIGADGRRSTVAKLVGTREHHKWDNRRMMAFAYYEDGQPELRHQAMQWRVDEELATVFPCDGDRFVALLMPPVSRADEFRADSEAAFDAVIDRVPQFRDRLRDCTRASRIFMSISHPAYFRHSHGPGWALTGDAGHFKDPVTAQGIRDALRFGRLLGEAAAPYLDDPKGLDAALQRWEHDRDAQCLPMYQWANGLGLADTVSPIELAAYNWFAAEPERAADVLGVFSRQILATDVFNSANLLRWVAASLRDPAVDNREVWRTLRRDVRREIDRVREARRFARRRADSVRIPLEPSEPGVVGDRFPALGTDRCKRRKRRYRDAPSRQSDRSPTLP